MTIQEKTSRPTKIPARRVRRQSSFIIREFSGEFYIASENSFKKKPSMRLHEINKRKEGKIVTFC